MGMCLVLHMGFCCFVMLIDGWLGTGIWLTTLNCFEALPRSTVFLHSQCALLNEISQTLALLLGWWILFGRTPCISCINCRLLGILLFASLFSPSPLLLSKTCARAALSLARGSDGVPILSWFPYPIPSPPLLWIEWVLMVDVGELCW